MAEPIHDKIKRFLQAAEGLYHRLVLLVGKTGSGKSGILRDIAEEFGSSVVNVNLALSGELLELTAKQRSLCLPGLLAQIADQAQVPVILDNLEILFDNGTACTEKTPISIGFFNLIHKALRITKATNLVKNALSFS